MQGQIQQFQVQCQKQSQEIKLKVNGKFQLYQSGYNTETKLFFIIMYNVKMSYKEITKLQEEAKERDDLMKRLKEELQRSSKGRR